MQGPAPRDLVEVATASSWCQRWRDGDHSWRQIHEGGFDARRYSVEPIDEATARAWICQHHYSGSYPAASQRYGLFDRAEQLALFAAGRPTMITAMHGTDEDRP